MALKTKLNPMGAFGVKYYTLTVITSPANATCVLTVNGVQYTTKSLRVKAGTVVGYTVSYADTTTKTGSITIDSDKTLTFTRTYSTETIDVDWTQPILSANGTLGGNSFAVSATQVYAPPYQAFDNNTSTVFQNNYGNTDLTLYYPQPFKITSLKVLNYYTSGYGYVITGLTVYGSDDNSNWTTINSSFTQPDSNGYQTITLTNSNYYKYYKLALTCNAIKEITITATTQQTSYTYYFDVTVL